MLSGTISSLTMTHQKHWEAYDGELEAGAEGEAQFSLKTTKNGVKYVEVDTDQNIFGQETDVKKMAGIVQRYIRQKLKQGKIEYAGIKVVEYTAGKYAHGGKSLGKSVGEAKMHAGTELLNILKAMSFNFHSKDEKKHKRAKYGWDYYNVLIRYKDTWFCGLANVMKTEDGD